MPRTRAAVFLVRAWWEDGAFRARVTYRLDTHGTEISIVTAASDELHRQLEAWLNAVSPTQE